MRTQLPLVTLSLNTGSVSTYSLSSRLIISPVEAPYLPNRRQDGVGQLHDFRPVKFAEGDASQVSVGEGVDELPGFKYLRDAVPVDECHVAKPGHDDECRAVRREY